MVLTRSQYNLFISGQGIGGCAVLQRDGRFVYYLTTKARYFEKPNYESLHSSLETMKKHCVENEVKNLAMPLIGCGLDGLSWNKVKDMIIEVFQDIPLVIVVYKLPPNPNASAQGGPSSRGRGRGRGRGGGGGRGRGGARRN